MLTCRQSVSLSPAVGCGSLCNSSAIENLCLYIIAPNLKLNKLQVYTQKNSVFPRLQKIMLIFRRTLRGKMAYLRISYLSMKLV